MRKYLIYIIFIVWQPLHAQYSTITGKITDERNAPLPYVTVRLTTPDSVFIQGNTTDTLGNYILSNIGTGDYLLFFSSIGYKPSIYPFRIENKDLTIQDIILKNSSVTLAEVEVKAQSFIRLEDRVMIIPEKQQVRHANTGYDLLYNLMIPGVDVDKREGKVKTFGGEVTLYINGRKADFREVQSLRPRDIEKVEYFDAPTGKYAMDIASINYITKKYTSGGYVSADAKQTIGYLNGDYNASAKIAKNNTSFAVWGGHRMQKYEGSKGIADETYIFPEYEINKHSETTDGLSRTNRQYAYADLENRTDRRTLLAKAGFTRNVTPEEWQELQTRYTGHYNHEDRARNTLSQTAINPSLSLYGNFKIKDNQTLETNIGSSYSNTLYERTYEEGNFQSFTEVDEDYYRLSASINYVLQMKKQQTFALHFYHNHMINSADYKGDYNQSTRYWAGQSRLYAEYAARIGKKFSFNLNAGLSSEMYQLSEHKFTQYLSPMYRIRLTYRFTNKQTLLLSSSMQSSMPAFNTMNPVEQKVDSFMIKRGDPDRKRLTMLNNVLTYNIQLGPVNINANAVYYYNSNAAFPYYFAENDKIINSFNNGSKASQYGGVLNIAWKALPNLQLKAEGIYMYLDVKGYSAFKHNVWYGSLQANYYWKSLGVTAFFKSPIHMMDLSASHTLYALNYGLTVNWSYRNWWIEAGTNAPFSKDLARRNYFDISPVYTYDKTIHDRTYQQMGWVKMAYTFDFGRKTARSKNNVTDIQSTILKAN